MNAPIARALLADAYYQVVDNKIFRLLLVLVLLIVAFFFLVGFRENEIQVLYGLYTMSYETFLSPSGGSPRGITDVQGLIIQGLQKLIVESLAGSMAMVFCTSATAFFVPRMLEKGSADILFSKPLSRTTLLLSRYFSGLIFVGMLSCLLLVGIYLGLLIVSGYNDPGFVLGALTLVYLFAILHSFSLLIGVLTRSTVAAILTSIMLFMFTGGIHFVWRTFEQTDESKRSKSVATSVEAGEHEAEAGAAPASGSVLIDAFRAAIYGLHYALPKTSDADILTRKVRKSIEKDPPKVVDADAEFTFVKALEDLGVTVGPGGAPERSRLALVSPAPSSSHAGTIAADLEHAPAVWTLTGADGQPRARFEITRRTSAIAPASDAASSTRTRTRKLSTSGATDELVQKLKTSAQLVAAPNTRKGDVDGRSAMFVDWSEAGAATPRSMDAAVFIHGGWVFEVRMSSEQEWKPLEARAHVFERFLDRVKLGNELAALDPESWYEKKFSLSAPWNYNILFSIGSSLAFIVVMLGLARWRLQRIDF